MQFWGLWPFFLRLMEVDAGGLRLNRAREFNTESAVGGMSLFPVRTSSLSYLQVIDLSSNKLSGFLPDALVVILAA